MGLLHGRAIALPYGFEVAGRDVRVFNRGYGVLAGFRLPRAPQRRHLERMAWDGEVHKRGEALRVWFYADHCLPITLRGRAAKADDTAAYFERLERFGRMQADQDRHAPWPWSDTHADGRFARSGSAEPLADDPDA